MSGKRDRAKRIDERRQEEVDAEAQRRRRLLQLAVGTTLLALIVVAVVVVASQSQGGSDSGDTDLEGAAAVETELLGIPQSGTVLGDSTAPVTLIEYADLQCPVCKSYSEEILPQIIGGPVRHGEAKLDFRNFTIISQESITAGAAAVAAGRQGRAWHFIEIFYRNQGPERSGYVTDDFLTAVAKAAGVPDIRKWNASRGSDDVLGEVHRSTSEAERLEIPGTPSFIVRGPGGTESLGAAGSAEAIEEAIRNLR